MCLLMVGLLHGVGVWFGVGCVGCLVGFGIVFIDVTIETLISYYGVLVVCLLFVVCYCWIYISVFVF